MNDIEIIDFLKYKALLDLNVPYCGGVDFHQGTILYLKTGIKDNPLAIGIRTRQVNIIIDKVVYTVKEGDTISSIASKLNLTVDEIANANKISNPDQIKTGDVISLDVDVSYNQKFEDYTGDRWFPNYDPYAPCVMSYMSECLGTDGKNEVNGDILKKVLGFIENSAGVLGTLATEAQSAPCFINAANRVCETVQYSEYLQLAERGLKNYNQNYFNYADKAKYTRNLNTLKAVDVLGTTAGAVCIGLSTVRFAMAKNEIEAGDAFLDGLFSAIGFMGPIGAGISVTYFIIDSSLGDRGVYGWLHDTGVTGAVGNAVLYSVKKTGAFCDETGISDQAKRMSDNLNRQRELTTDKNGIWQGAHNHFK